MKFSLVTVVAVTSLAAAAPGYPSSTTRPGPPSSVVTCLSASAAQKLVNGFAGLLTAYTDNAADALLTSDFTDTSSSINVIAGYPADSVTFPSKAAFKAGQGAQPPIGFELLAIDEVDCTKVGFRWKATPNLGNPTITAKGINSFVAKNLNGTENGWQIQTMYSEFNSCSWVLAFGGKCGFS